MIDFAANGEIDRIYLPHLSEDEDMYYKVSEVWNKEQVETYLESFGEWLRDRENALNYKWYFFDLYKGDEKICNNITQISCWAEPYEMATYDDEGEFAGFEYKFYFNCGGSNSFLDATFGESDVAGTEEEKAACVEYIKENIFPIYSSWGSMGFYPSRRGIIHDGPLRQPGRREAWFHQP